MDTWKRVGEIAAEIEVELRVLDALVRAHASMTGVETEREVAAIRSERAMDAGIITIQPCDSDAEIRPDPLSDAHG